ncbi:MAG: ArsA family ATPase [Acidimicrobiales bacterium]
MIGPLADLVERNEVVVCCGTGGVGKTTTAAALALAGARAGRRAVVVTIDPAKRLADALDLDALGNVPHEIEGPWPGRLAAMMLDTKTTFDDLVSRYSPTPEQARRIIDNTFYRNISTTLSGTQDYMAVEKLIELHDSGDWDLVVVDTPPTRDALAFLEAPRLLARLLDNTIFRLVTAPGRGMMRAVNTAAQTVLRQLSRVVGASVVDDAVAFFQAFDGMQDGFRERADRTLTLLGDERTAFALVASSRSDTLAEARYFLKRVEAAGLDIDAVVINRLLPSFATGVDEANRLAETLAGSELGGPARALADIKALGEGDDERVAALTAMMPDAIVARVPLMHRDIHDLDGLTEVAEILTRS